MAELNKVILKPFDWTDGGFFQVRNSRSAWVVVKKSVRKRGKKKKKKVDYLLTQNRGFEK